MEKKRKLNARDARRERAKAAMPEVKRLVTKFGRMAVSSCLNKIKARDKELSRLTALKKQVAALEKGLR